MKTIDKFRDTRSFCIHGTDIMDLAAIMKRFDDTTVVTVARDRKSEDGVYTVRTASYPAIVDYRVKLDGARSVRIVETMVIRSVI